LADFDNFWQTKLRNNLMQMTVVLAIITLILWLHYLVKFRSFVAIHNNKFILGSACVGSEIIN